MNYKYKKNLLIQLSESIVAPVVNNDLLASNTNPILLNKKSWIEKKKGLLKKIFKSEKFRWKLNDKTQINIANISLNSQNKKFKKLEKKVKKGPAIFTFNSNKNKNVEQKNPSVKPVHIADNVEIKCVNVEKVVKELGGAKTVILKNINLEINKGEITVILGPSGSGKTTLLNVIAGIDKASSGQCYIKNIDINSISDKQLVLIRRKYISYIYQRYGLIPILSCYDNIRLGQHLVEKNKRVMDINEIIKIVGISSLLEKFPHELSGGQRQRVAIARAIMKQPEVMLCDEPTAALDSETSKKIIDLFLEVNRKFNTTIVMVTHEPSFVNIATKVIYIKDGEIEKIVEKSKNANQSSSAVFEKRINSSSVDSTTNNNFQKKSNFVDVEYNSNSSIDNRMLEKTVNATIENEIVPRKEEEQIEAYSTTVKVLDSKLNKEKSYVDEFIEKRKFEKIIRKKVKSLK